jgi:hypothetical protein
MWLGLTVFVLLVVAIVGSIASGGIFTIALVPIVVIAGATALVHFVGARLRSKSIVPESSGNSLPRSHATSPSHVTTTPDGLVDARREQG